MHTSTSSSRITDMIRHFNMGIRPSFCGTAQLDQDELKVMLSCGPQNGLSADAVMTETLTLFT